MRCRRIAYGLLAIGLLSLASSACAQLRPPGSWLSRGQRVSAPLSVAPQLLEPLADSVKCKVATYAGTGALIGGVALGLGLTLYTIQICEGSAESCFGRTVGSAAIGAVVGASLGAMIGSAFPKHPAPADSAP
jgi:hypothetical protein